MAGIIQKLFGQHKPQKEQVEEPPELTDEIFAPASEPEGKAEVEVIEEALEIHEFVETPPPQLIAGSAQSVGMQRDHNEDALFTLTMLLSGGHSHFPFGLYIVADGMGGHKYGEIASEMAARAMGSHIVRRLFTALIGPRPAPPEESIQEIIQTGVLHAHQTISKEAPGGGTTMTAVLILGEQLTVAHIGDTRAYYISATGEVTVLTRDHSLVKRLVELGQITVEEAAVHPQRNVLYRALGQGEPSEADVTTSPLPEAGYLLICSDGLWGVVREQEIVEIILTTPDPHEACWQMIEAANAAGGPDNITAILVHLPSG